MDRLLYVAMTGAAETLNAQTLHANNLANINTTGFKVDLQQQRSMPVYGDGYPSRVYAATERPGQNLLPGGLEHTHNPFDLAIKGDGWFAVLDQDGVESYTKRGDLKLDLNNQLINGSGDLMLGEGGPITLPQAESVTFSSDGVISYVPLGADPGTNVVLDRLKLVNLDKNNIEKTLKGNFENKDKTLAEADVSVRLESGFKENSNVNAVNELINIISLARKHELDVKMMSKAEENDQAAARILQIT